jgi:hypothetical protein
MPVIYCAECGEVSHSCECAGGVVKEDQKLLMELPWVRREVNARHDYQHRNCPYFRLYMMTHLEAVKTR